MYFGFLGGSALLHLLAAHPNLLATLGIAATISMLITSLGPQNYLGSGQQMNRIEQSLPAGQLADAAVEELMASARRLATMPAAEVAPIVRQVLQQCGNSCATLTPAVVMNDAALLQSVLVVSELERRSSGLPPLTDDRVAELLNAPVTANGTE